MSIFFLNKVQRIIRTTSHTRIFFFFKDKKGVGANREGSFKRIHFVSADECPKATTHFPSCMWLGFFFQSFTPVDVSPLPDVCGLGFISFSHSNLSRLEIELERSPKNSWLNS